MSSFIRSRELYSNGAAQLRATSGLKTPDAIHAATALEHGCTLFVTNDPAFRRLTTVPVVILGDLLVT